MYTVYDEYSTTDVFTTDTDQDTMTNKPSPIHLDYFRANESTLTELLMASSVKKSCLSVMLIILPILCISFM